LFEVSPDRVRGVHRVKMAIRAHRGEAVRGGEACDGRSAWVLRRAVHADP
jgi:hypothetical protein